jgi:hypothetical protein
VSKHSSIGASGAKRWMACPASIVLAERSPADVSNKTSAYAEEGTKAHNLAEAILRREIGIPLGEGDKHILDEVKGDDEMFKYVAQYCQPIVDLVEATPDAEVQIEAHVNMAYVHPDLFGTADAVVFDPNEQHLHVFDLKYGQGIMVDAEENPQLLFYAGCVFMDYMPKTITSYIIQPRANTGDTHKSWTYGVDRLMDFEGELKSAIGRIDHIRDTVEGKPITAEDVCVGDHCQFCPAVSICPKHLANFTALEEVIPQDGKLVEQYTDEQVHHFLSMQKPMMKWFASLEEGIESRLLDGEDLEHFKLVNKRANRAWKNEATVKRKFGKRKVTKEVMLSPSQAEKVLGKEVVEPYWEKPEAGVTMALVGDRRKAVNPPALEMFGKLED